MDQRDAEAATTGGRQGRAGAGGPRVAYRTCPLCEATCGLALTVDGDRVTHTRGDDRDVFSRGFLCPKGTTLGEMQHDPDRLRRPLVREGAGATGTGDGARPGRLVEASWDAAFARVDASLRRIVAEHGRDAVAVYLGNPNVHTLAGQLYTRPLLKALRTRNIFSASTVDQMPKHVASGLMYGRPVTIAVPDLDRTDYLLMLGADPVESNGSLCTAPDFPGRLRAIRDRGGRVVVVDPRRSRTARRAHEHVFIRPGTDALLLMAILHVLLAEDRAAPGALAAHLAGADALPQLARPFSPSRVAPVCGVDAAVIERIARELAGAPTAVVYGRMGTTTARFGTVTSWLIDVVNAITGNLDRPGGAMFPTPAHDRVRARSKRGFRVGRWQSRVRELPEVMGELPVATLADEIETPGPGQIRALITIAGNPVLSTPDGGRLDRALARLELVVSVDPYCNETTRHADVILPPPPPLERAHMDLAFYGLAVRNVANYSPPVLPLADDAMAEEEILLRLSLIAMGHGASADPWRLDDMIAAQLVSGEVNAAGSPVHGRAVGDILAAVAPRRGAERLLDILIRTGPYGDAFAGGDGLTLAALEASPHGVDLGPLVPGLPDALTTPSGKVELAPEPIRADVARLARALDDGATAFGVGAGAQLLLIGRRHLRSNNSWMHNLRSLVRGKPRCTLLIHPDDARPRGLADGGIATVRSRVGEVEIAVEVTGDIMPGVVSMPHGWGHDRPGARLSVASEHPGASANALTDPAMVDAPSGNAVLNGVPVTVSAAARGA